MPGRMVVLTAVVLLAGLVAPVAAAPRFVVGRSPAIFQKDPDRVATRLGVWFDGSYVDNDSDPGSVDLNHLNLLVDTRWRSFQGFLEVEYEREAGLDGGEEEHEFEVEQAYLRFGSADRLSLRVGRFNTPAGIWLPIHWSILMDTIEKPPHAAKELFPEQHLGLEISGRRFPSVAPDLDVQLDYAVFAGLGSDRLDQKGVEGVTIGVDVRLLLDQRYLLGISSYRQKNDSVADRSELNFLVYGEAKLPGPLTFRTEYLHQRRERSRGSRYERTLDLVYVKLRWDFARWFYANYRVSYGDDDGEDQRTTEQLINTFTLGADPLPAVRIKLEYAFHDFQAGRRDDFHFWGASLGVRF